MKKSLLLTIVAVVLLAAGLSGYFAFHRTGSADVKTTENVSVSASGVPAVSIPASVAPAVPVSVNPPAVAVPHSAAASNVSQPKTAVQVIAVPGSRFQPLDETQILDQRVTTVSKDRKKRELLVKTGGKYPVRRVEETLVKNDGAETYSILSRTEMAADHVLVKLQEGKTEDDLRAMLKGYGISILRPLKLPGHYIVSLKAPTLDAAPEAVSVLSGESNVLANVEPDFFSRILRAPNDPKWSDLWGMVKINATGAWDRTTGSTNVIVAVIDTGIDLTHPDLVSNLWVNAAEANGAAGVDDDGNGFIDDVHGWDFQNNYKDPVDDHGHGTHVAGTIGAVGNNATGVVGVCWTVRLMALRAGDGDGFSDSDVAEAIQYASDKGARIINASYGGSEFSSTESDAMIYANSKGVLFVAAAGNAGGNNDLVPMYPASYDIPNVVAVAATGTDDAMASFSNYGKTSVDLAAPGVDIFSTVPGGGIESMQGTSMACPHVAGAAALLLSANPSYTYLQVKAALLNTVDKVSALSGKTVSGGRLNVKKLIVLLDTDGDGMPDDWEAANGLATNNAADALLDPDGDHLNNLNEYLTSCNPTNSDNDTDSLADGWEVTYGFNPNSPTGGLATAYGLGSFNTSGDAKNVTVSGNYAYVADGENGLVILNVADPQNPVLAGSYDTTGIAYDVAVAGNYAYVADGVNGLVVINITNKAAPWRAGWTNTAGSAKGVSVQSNYVYIADGTNELVIFSNATNPAALKLQKDYTGSLRTMNDIFVRGTSAYLAMNETVWRFDVAIPAKPVVKYAAAFTTWNMIGIHGNGSVVAAVAGDNGVKIMNTTNLTVLGSYDTDGTASGVFVSGSYAYIADGTNGLVVLDVRTPASPTLAVRIPTKAFAYGVFVNGAYAYVTEGSAGIEIFSILSDADGDGMLDGWEMTWFGTLARDGSGDYDGDGISDRGEYLAGLNPTRPDQDGDGLTDGLEACRSMIFTNLPFYNTDPRKVDTDGDGLVDGHDGVVSNITYSAGVDANHNGFVDGELDHGCNATNTDSDADGMNDGWEVRYGFDPTSNLSPGPSGDDDGDGLTNLEESQYGTNPTIADTDGDGMPDGWEVHHGLNPLVNDAMGDPDSDELVNILEYSLCSNSLWQVVYTNLAGAPPVLTTNMLGSADPNKWDTDGDGMPDGWEVKNSLSPTSTNGVDGASGDPDGDGLENLQEYQKGANPHVADTDGDGMPDGWEVRYGLLPTSTNGVNGAFGDPDGDKLLNIQEYSLCDSNLWLGVYTSVTGAPPVFFFGPPPTNPTPGMPGSTDPQKADSDSDGLNDYYEITTNASINNIFITNPNNADTDGDGLPDKWEVDNYPGSNPTVPALPTDDSDGDGLTNGEEASLGTNPANGRDPVFVDDDAPGDPGPQDPEYSDLAENGSKTHPFDSIQEAINSTNMTDGMTVLITNGWYAFTGNYSIDPQGKAITIRSWNGPDVTTVTSLGLAEVFNFSSGETTNTVVKGLAIKSNIGRCSDGDCDWVDIITISNSSPVIRDCAISDGGLSGVKCIGASYPQLISCTIADVRNGIWCEKGAAPVVISNLIQNAYVTSGWTFDEDWGNGVFATNGSGMIIRSTTIEGCEGRGMHVQSASNLRIEDSVIFNNWGGLRLRGVDGALIQSQILNNNAPNYYKIGTQTFKNRQVLSGISEDVTFENENGAGILLTEGTRLRVENTVIAGNRTWAQDPKYYDSKLVPEFGLGGGLYVGTGCSVTGVNVTVSDNQARTRGGGVSSHQLSLFRNAIVWGNTSENVYVTTNIAYVDLDPRWNELHCRSGNITVWHGDIGYPYYSDPKVYIFGIIIADNPLFVGSGDYRLSSASPCIDVGSPADAPTNDLVGTVRPSDGDGNTNTPPRYDLGAYEYFYSTALGDADGDGLTDAQEIALGTDPHNPDTDGDDMPDGWEFTYMPPLNPTNSLDGLLDSDLDGLTNKFEYINGCNPTNSNTDADGMPDGWEVKYSLSPISTNGVDGASGDPDLDGLTNLQEYTLGTNPRVADTDGDGFSDGFEVANGFNPLVAENPAITDHDQDGLTDDQEFALGTNPANGRDPVYVDDNAPTDPMPGEPNISNTNENGSVAYPFDSIQEAIDSTNTVGGMTILVTNGLYEGTGNYDINPGGKGIAIRAWEAAGTNTVIKTHAYGPAFVVNSGESTNTVIQGFTIETYGDLAPEEGIVVSGSGPVIKNCVIHNCELEAISCLNGAAPRILNCRFYDVPNGLYADGSAGVLLQQSVISNTTGRGIVIVDDDLAEITWSTIENCAGGITLNNSDAEIRQCIVRNNTNTSVNGAGILLQNNSSPLIQNALIVGNAGGSGGGLYISAGCNPTGVNCTVVNNSAVYSGGGLSSSGRPLLRNMIVWGNTAVSSANINLSNNVINIWYSDIEGGYSNAVLCITNNPQFVGGGNYRLASTNSPCYDAGTYYLAPLVDIDGNLRPVPADYPVRVDMGCYEFGASAATNPIALGAELALGAEADPLADTDGDGVSDRNEMIAGTDSQKATDYFRVYHEQSLADGSVLITWQSAVGSLYTVQSTDNLISGVWSNTGSIDLRGTGNAMSFSTTTDSTVRYYRVVVRRP